MIFFNVVCQDFADVFEILKLVKLDCGKVHKNIACHISVKWKQIVKDHNKTIINARQIHINGAMHDGIHEFTKKRYISFNNHQNEININISHKQDIVYKSWYSWAGIVCEVSV